MPIYQYDCRFCKKQTEEFHKITRIPKRIRCACGHVARRTPAGNAILTDGDVKWLPSAKDNLPNDARHIETRSEWKSYCRKKGLECVG